MLRDFDHARDVSMRLKRDVVAVDPDIALLLGAMKDQLELLPSVGRLGAKVKSVPADAAAQVSDTRAFGGCWIMRSLCRISLPLCLDAPIVRQIDHPPGRIVKIGRFSSGLFAANKPPSHIRVTGRRDVSGSGKVDVDDQSGHHAPEERAGEQEFLVVRHSLTDSAALLNATSRCGSLAIPCGSNSERHQPAAKLC